MHITHRHRQYCSEGLGKGWERGGEGQCGENRTSVNIFNNKYNF